MSRWICLAMEVESAEPDGLDDARMEALAEGVARWLSVEWPGQLMHRYAPQGLSLVRHGPTGRLALHTWPERGVATLDVWAPHEVLGERWEALAAWISRQPPYVVREARLHAHPSGPS